MKPELVVAFKLVGFYFIVWVTIRGMLAMTEGFFLDHTKRPAAEQEEWLAGLQHVRMLMSMFCLTGAVATVVLVALALNPIFGLLAGALSALVVSLLSRRV